MLDLLVGYNYPYGSYYNTPSTPRAFNDITSTTSNAEPALIAVVFIILGIIVLVALAVGIVSLIANYKLFKKMGIDGWKSLIPMVNSYLQMEATGVDTRWLLIVCFGGLVCLVPILGWLVYCAAFIYFAIVYYVSLARSFGKSDAFAVGLILLNPIFLWILAFGNSKYLGAKPMEDALFGNKKNKK